jgi:thiamine-monophosphate kinase
MTATFPPLSGEDAVVARTLHVLGDASAALAVGPGHDCAVAEVDGARVVLTTDVLVDGVHFRLETCGPEAAATKAVLVNLSDLAATAALPVAFEVGVVLPRGGGGALADGIARGLAAAGRAWNVPCAGGDTNVADGPLVLSVTAVGRPGPTGRLVTREGARPGDVLSVTGPLGGSLHGRHLSFTPRIREAQILVQADVPHAMMDLSDGLSRDLPRLCRMSGVGAVVDAAHVPVHPDAVRARDERSVLARALDDGEDFELLLAHAPLDDAALARLREEGVRLYPVGEVVPASEGILLREQDGLRPLPPRGYDHFAAELESRSRDA